MSRDEILQNVKKVHKFATSVDKSVDPAVHIQDANEDLYSEFIQRIAANKAFVIESSAENLQNDIQNIINKEGVSNLIYPASLSFDVSNLNINKFEFNKPIDEFKSEIFNYDVSIIDARGGVSSHGVACIASSKTQPRLLSLAPKVCIVLIKKDSIVKTLANMLNKIKSEDGRLPTNVVFISGPSRTSDIELQLVLGVHGSQIFYAITY